MASMQLDWPSDEHLKTGFVSLIDTGKQCTISGYGEIFDNFLKTYKLEGFTGFGRKPSGFYDADYETAPCRVMNFDQTYHKMPYDCRRSEFTFIFI